MQEYSPGNPEDETHENYVDINEDEGRFVNPADEYYEDEYSVGNHKGDDKKIDDCKVVETSIKNSDNKDRNIAQSYVPVTINKDNTALQVSGADIPKSNNQNTIVDKFYVREQNVYTQKMANYCANQRLNFDIASNEKSKYDTLESRGKFLINKYININKLIRLWKYKDDFYFRFSQKSEIWKGNKNYISDVMKNILDKNIRIVSEQDITKNSSISHNQIQGYIFTHQIPLIDKEVFRPSEKEFFQEDGMWYKNTFLSTKFLEKRFLNIDSKDFYDCFIICFLENLVGEIELNTDSKPKTIAILKWLSRCFITMSSTHIALVFNGSKYLEDIFWEKLIKPIFGNEQYCIRINDETLKKPLSEIVEEKIFFKIEDFTPTEENKQKIEELLKAILVDKYLLVKTYKQPKIPVFAQAFITANETLSYMKKYHTLFEHINVLDENKIISNLAENSIDLEIKFNDEKEIDIFTDCLAVFDKNNSKRLQVISQFIQRDEEETLDKKIDAFIQAIKKQDKAYFKNVNDNDPTMYKELEFTFGKECFIGQDLAKYFNLVYSKEIFPPNSGIPLVLKKRDAMFTQELTIIKAMNGDKQEEVLFKGIPTYKEAGSKKLYKINDYTLPEDILVPRGWIITNRKGNERFKYNYEDIDLAKEGYKQYDKSKLI